MGKRELDTEMSRSSEYIIKPMPIPVFDTSVKIETV